MLAAAAAALGPRAAAALDARFVDGPTLLSVAARHGLRGVVLEALSRLPSLPPALDRTDVDARRMKVAATNLMSLSAARKAVGALEAENIRAALAATPAAVMLLAGASTFELGRPRLVVAGKDLEAANRLLGGGTADVETGDEAMVARSVETPIAGGAIRALTPDDLVIALCRRANARGWQRLDYVLAAALLLRGLNGSLSGRREATDRSVLVAVLLARDALNVASPLAAVASRDRRALRTAEAVQRSWFLPQSTSRATAATPMRARGGRELWVAGFPSAYGGADTELDHLIDLLRDRGVEVNLVPMFGANEESRESVLARGCRIHDYRADIFRGKVVASFCNGEFLAALPDIVRAGRPAKVVWFNCMTWLFDREREAHAQGWIDVFGFQSDYQRHALTSQLEAIGPVRTFPYRPFFSASRVTWEYREWQGSYRLGRISRDDAAKFAPDTWQIFGKVQVPDHLDKKVYVLGFGPNAAAKIGDPPPALDCQTWAPGGIATSLFYRTIDTMIHKTGGSRENYSRVLCEAYAHGVVPIVERDFGFPELVVHGETGFMTSNSEEMSEYASMLALNPREHRRLSENGRRHLEETLAAPDACWEGWKDVLEL